MGIVDIIVYLLWVGFSAFVSYRLMLSGLPKFKQCVYIGLLAIIVAILFGITKGLVFLLLAPIAVFLIPYWVIKSDNKHK